MSATPVEIARPQPLTPQQRREIVAAEVQKAVGRGWRVESQTDTQAVLVKGRRPNHLLHFLVGLFTIGVWWVVWILIAVFSGEKRKAVTVGEFGGVTTRKG